MSITQQKRKIGSYARVFKIKKDKQMTIGGLQKTSLIDYPGKISSVIFIRGCNFSCPYCHNANLIKGNTPQYKDEEILAFLKERQSFIEGVVISGGEPTTCDQIEKLCAQIKQLGYPIKLDTNGSSPNKIGSLLDKKLIDYVAMDIKTEPALYSPIFLEELNPEKILESIELIKGAKIPYEFRTTCAKPIINEQRIQSISKIITGAKLYVLQQFNDKYILNPSFFENIHNNYNQDDLNRFKEIAEQYVQECVLKTFA